MIEEISKQEALDFMAGLEEEKETFWLSEEEVASSHIIIGERIEGRIVGIGGVRKIRIFPLSYIAVEKGYQKKSIGYRLLYRINTIAKGRHNYLMATILAWNVGAQKIANRNDYRTFGKWEDRLYLIHPVNDFGEAIWKLLFRTSGPLIKIWRNLAKD